MRRLVLKKNKIYENKTSTMNLNEKKRLTKAGYLQLQKLL